MCEHIQRAKKIADTIIESFQEQNIDVYEGLLALSMIIAFGCAERESLDDMIEFIEEYHEFFNEERRNSNV